MSRLTIHEILTQANNAKNYIDKMNAIRQNGSLVLEQILQYNFAEHLKFSLPEGRPPFKRETDVPVGKSATNLYQESRRLYVFLEGMAENLPAYKKELMFIQILEGLHFTEADILVAVKDKKLQELYPNITYEFVYEAIPDLLPPPETRKQAQKSTKPVQETIPEVKVEEVPAPFVKPPQTPPTLPIPIPIKAKEPNRDMSWRAGLPAWVKKVFADQVRADIAAGKEVKREDYLD